MWQRDGEFIHLNELCPAGCYAVGMPIPVAVVEASLPCTGIGARAE